MIQTSEIRKKWFFCKKPYFGIVKQWYLGNSLVCEEEQKLDHDSENEKMEFGAGMYERMTKYSFFKRKQIFPILTILFTEKHEIIMKQFRFSNSVLFARSTAHLISNLCWLTLIPESLVAAIEWGRWANLYFPFCRFSALLCSFVDSLRISTTTSITTTAEYPTRTIHASTFVKWLTLML